DFAGAIADEQRDAVVSVPLRRCQRELFGAAMFEVLGEIDAVVSGTRFFAKRDDLTRSAGVEFDQAFAEAMPDHAVADDDDLLLRTHPVSPRRIMAPPRVGIRGRGVQVAGEVRRLTWNDEQLRCRTLPRDAKYKQIGRCEKA